MTAYNVEYDRVHYTGNPHRETRPDRLEVVARLHALETPPPAGARVLEIGCATGSNLLPMAEVFPHATFVGIDLAATQIEVAKELAAAAGIKNVELVAMDLCAIDERMGTFDYILAHGIYSWVPLPVREKLLEVCGRALSPNGVAIISHNVLPGWHQRRLAGEIMRHHTRSIADPRERVRQARAMLDFAMRGSRPTDQLYRAILAEQMQSVVETPDWGLLHDFLAEINDACTFHEFCERLKPHGLRFVADSDVASMSGVDLPPETLGRLSRFELDVIQRETYFDILRNRKFRRTIVARETASVSHELRPERLAGLYVGSQARAEGEDTFIAPNAKLRISEPGVQKIMHALIQRWPQLLKIDELAAAVGRGNGKGGVEDEVLRLLVLDVVEVSTGPALGPLTPGERPRISPLARLFLERGVPVANLRHEQVLLDEAGVKIALLLDGTLTRAELASVIGAPSEPVLTKFAARSMLVD